MLGLLTTLAGIGFDPEIRGILVVTVGVAVLMGSVWLLLVTNTGTRLGSLIALSGLFGWFAIMGVIWWIYGIGYRGDLPTWVVQEISYDISQASTGPAAELPEPDSLPRAIDILREYGSEEAIVELDTIDVETLSEERTARNDALPDGDPRKLDEAGLQAAVDEAIAEEQAKDEALTLSALAAVDPEAIEAARADGLLEFNGWNLVSSAGAGEAQATADEALREEGVFASAGEYTFLDTWQQGGKPTRDEDDMWSRVKHKITSTLRITHPTNYSIVQVRPVIPEEAEPGQPPPFLEADESQPVVSVVMVRDLGDLRLLPALFTVGSTFIFLGLCWVMHLRDRELRRREAALAGAVA